MTRISRADSFGASWSSADPLKFSTFMEEEFQNPSLALRLCAELLDGMPGSQRERLGGQEREFLGFLILFLFKELEQGNICLDLYASVLKRRIQFLESRLDPARWKTLALELEQGGFAPLVGRLESSAYGKIPLELKDSPIVFQVGVTPEGKTWKLCGFARYFQAKLQLEQQVQEIRSADLAPLPESTSGFLASVCTDLDRGQERAVRSAFDTTLSVISGGPGTGKTFVMARILAVALLSGFDKNRIRLVAPTGKAAKRMTEAVNQQLKPFLEQEAEPVSGETLHRALGFGRRGPRYHAGLPLDVDLILVDEASMVDILLMSDLFQALRPGTRVVLIGDRDQLPSVNAGAAFTDIMNRLAGFLGDGFVELRRNYRSNLAVIRLSEAVNQGKLPEAFPILNLSEALRNSENTLISSEGSFEADLKTWLEQIFLEDDEVGSYQKLLGRLQGREPDDLELGQLFEKARKGQVLALMRQGPYGVLRLNQIISEFLAPRLGASSLPLFPGALVMVTANDFHSGLFNGEIGIYLPGAQGTPWVYFQAGQGYQKLTLSKIRAWELSFAITVHKSQGSEFDQVFLVIPEEAPPSLLNRQMVYTAITRARARILIYAEKENLKKAVSRKITRESGLFLSR